MADNENQPANSQTPSGADRTRFIEELYRSCWGELCRRLRRLYGDGPPEPEDIAQSAFAKITALDNLKYIENPRAFLFTTAVNLGLNAIDRIVRARKFIDGEMHRVGQNVEEITPETVYQDREHLNTVQQAIDSLSEKQRQVLLRSRLKGETYAQISAATGWSPADISRQLKAALAVIDRATENRSANEYKGAGQK